MSVEAVEIRSLSPIPLWPDEPPCGLVDGAELPTLQPFLPQATAPTAAVVVCPGGGYGGLADHEGDPVATWLAGLGVAGVVLRYRVAPHRHPAPLADVLRAIRLTRANAAKWNIDPRRVGVLGFSAGGHLAASAATLFDSDVPVAGDDADAQPSRPDAAVLCYPVILSGEHGHVGSFRNLLGPEANAAEREPFSLEKRVSSQTPPTFLWHTADDGGVDVRNSLAFAAACRQHDVPVELHVFPHGSHGLGLAKDTPAVSAWTHLCATWLASIGFRTGA